MAKSVDRVARGRSHGYDVLRGFNGQATTGFRRRFVPARGGFVPRFARFVPARARFVPFMAGLTSSVDDRPYAVHRWSSRRRPRSRARHESPN